MNDIVSEVERDALRGIAHLLHEPLKRVIGLIAETPPPTPAATVPAPTDAAVARLDGIEHVVVVMLENRSFDHMLGYLSLPEELGGHGRTEVDGLTGPETNFNLDGEQRVPIRHLDALKFKDETEDPDHSGPSTDEQLSGDCGGFVRNFARISAQRAKANNEQAPDPSLVMGYYSGRDLPVYDHLAREYCIIDRWFSSVPGATWPNRLYATTGQAAETREDLNPPIYSLPSFARHLDDHGVGWRWYSYDPATLRMVDPAYRLRHHEHFAYVDSRALSLQEDLAGDLFEEGTSFLDDAAAGRLPAVSWIDPHFKDAAVLGPNSNDDHPPSDVAAGQDLVLQIFHALRTIELWSKALMLVVYDEHGGFYDHVLPPASGDDEKEFARLGVRVPALLISPFVSARSVSSQLAAELHFDHTSIIKTILTRFCNKDGQIPAMTPRVQRAHHLGHRLADGPPRDEAPNHADIVQAMTARQ